MNENAQQTTHEWFASLPRSEFKDYLSMLVSSTGVLLRDIPLDKLSDLNADPLDRAAINKLIFEIRDGASAEPSSEASDTPAPQSNVEADRSLIESVSVSHNLDTRISQLRQTVTGHRDSATDLQRRLSSTLSLLNEHIRELESLTSGDAPIKPLIEQIMEIEAAGFWEFVGIDAARGKLWLHTRRNVHLTYINPAAGINRSQDTGQFALSIDLRRNNLSNLRCIPTFRTVGVLGSTSPHPHTSSGNLCWGDGTDRAASARVSGDIVKLASLTQALLTTYEPSNPYISLEQMERVEQERGFEDGFNIKDICDRGYIESAERGYLTNVLYPRLSIDPNLGIEKSVITELRSNVNLFKLYRRVYGSYTRYLMPYSIGSGGVACVRFMEVGNGMVDQTLHNNDACRERMRGSGRTRETYDHASFARDVEVDDNALLTRLLNLFGEVTDYANDGSSAPRRGRLQWGTFVNGNGSNYGEWMICAKIMRLTANTFVSENGVVFKDQNDSNWIHPLMPERDIKRTFEENNWVEEEIADFLAEAWDDLDFEAIYTHLESTRDDEIDVEPVCDDCNEINYELDSLRDGIQGSRDTTAGWTCPNCGYHN